MRSLNPGRLLLVILAAASMVASAQSLPPIYDKVPVETAPVTMVAEFPKGTFLENVAVDAQGTLFVNSHLEGKVYRIDAQGRRSEWTTVDGTIAGIALSPDGSALLSGWIKGKEPAVFQVDAQGRNQVLLPLPGGMFPNGVLRLAEGRFLVADSYRGLIWQIDVVTKTASVWVEDESLSRASSENPTPAVNGLKVFGGAVYASNTAKQLLVKIPLQGGRAGKPEVLRQNVGLDDFDFDASGNLYGTTHVYNSLVRIEPSGKVTTIAGLGQGMAGSTAVAYQPGPGGARLIVVTNGGMSLPPAGGVQSGKVLKVDLAGTR